MSVKPGRLTRRRSAMRRSCVICCMSWAGRKQQETGSTTGVERPPRTTHVGDSHRRVRRARPTASPSHGGFHPPGHRQFGGAKRPIGGTNASSPTSSRRYSGLSTSPVAPVSRSYVTMCAHSSASERATTATTGSVSLRLKTSCGIPGSMKMKSPAPFSTDLLEVIAVLVAHAPAQDVEHHLEADVHVREGDRARRDGGDVHRQLLGVDVLGRHPGLVLDAVPGAHGLAVADDGEAVVVLYELSEIEHGRGGDWTGDGGRETGVRCARRGLGPAIPSPQCGARRSGATSCRP